MLNVSDSMRGYIDTVILSQLSTGDTYGYEITKTVNRLSQGRFELKEATLYTAFRRLEQDGFILSYWGDEDSGARRRYYSLTQLGKVQLAENRRDWQNVKQLLDILISETCHP
ncbi:MAG: PadR family transcriptional regulator [Spirochaetales bacterium]